MGESKCPDCKGTRRTEAAIPGKEWDSERPDEERAVYWRACYACPTCNGTGKAAPALSALAKTLSTALLRASERKGMGWLDDYVTATADGKLLFTTDAYDLVRAIAELLAHAAAEAKREARNENARLQGQLGTRKPGEPSSTPRTQVALLSNESAASLPQPITNTCLYGMAAISIPRRRTPRISSTRGAVTPMPEHLSPEERQRLAELAEQARSLYRDANVHPDQLRRLLAQVTALEQALSIAPEEAGRVLYDGYLLSLSGARPLHPDFDDLDGFERDAYQHMATALLAELQHRAGIDNIP